MAQSGLAVELSVPWVAEPKGAWLLVDRRLALPRGGGAGGGICLWPPG